MAAQKRILIIGAGASGIVCVKTCLEEGLLPVCMEQEDFIGGLWQFTADERHSTVYKSTVINTSKEMMAFSDFPIPKEYPSYMHNSQIIEYFKSYIEHFGLQKYIHFHHTVLKASKAPDHDATGRWVVRYSKSGVEVEEVFDGIMVASGHHWKKRFPSFPGMDIFKGRQMHSHSYKDFKGFEDLNVVVVGVGNSGCDLAVELSRHSKHVYLSTRSGAWILNRIEHGLPSDLLFSTRAASWIPIPIKNKLAGPALTKKLNLENFGLQPNFPLFNAHPTMNGEILGRIAVGAVSVHPNVAKLTEHSVIFDDGFEVKPDVVIYSTGYEISFPFLDVSEIKVNDNQVDLFKFVFPPHLQVPSLAFVGLIQPWGAIMPISEMQARWITRVFNGKVNLPASNVMRAEIENTRAVMAKRYKKSARHTIQTDYVTYMDSVAQEIGVYPSFWEIFKKDRSLLKSIYFDATVPAQYRLVGPNAWSGAPTAIRSAIARSVYPARTRKTEKTPAGDFEPTIGDYWSSLKTFATLALARSML